MNIASMLEEKNIPYEAIPHRDTYEAQRMAEALHVSGREVAKTVLLRVDDGEDFVVAVLPANKTVDLKNAGEILGGATELANEEEVARQCPDCETGVLPPFGSRYGMQTIVDESLNEDKHIYFEGNTHHEAIRMRFADFLKVEVPKIRRFTK